MLIRRETEADKSAVEELLLSTFEENSESRLVTQLRAHAKPLVSLVAEQDGKVIGHILFSPVILDSNPSLQLMGLAPMAVKPSQQRLGIGTALIEAGLHHCQQQKIGAVVVLGHPDYYPKFGFSSAADYDIKSEYDVPTETFMLIELQEDYLHGHSGTVQYHEAFKAL